MLHPCCEIVDTISLQDSDTYEDPQGENDDSYEPPPCERVFNPTLSVSMHREEYAGMFSLTPLLDYNRFDVGLRLYTDKVNLDSSIILRQIP